LLVDLRKMKVFNTRVWCLTTGPMMLQNLCCQSPSNSILLCSGLC